MIPLVGAAAVVIRKKNQRCPFCYCFLGFMRGSRIFRKGIDGSEYEMLTSHKT